MRARDVRLWFDNYSLKAPGGANRTLDVLRQILNYAVDCGLLKSNPADGVIRNRRTRLTRFLSRAEIARLHAALTRMGAVSPDGSRRKSSGCSCLRAAEKANW